MAAESEGCCSCCLSAIVTMGLTALFLWLSLRVDEPKCYLDSIYVPALNKSLNSPSNATIFFTLKLVNGNKDKGIQYDDVQLAFGIFLDSNTTRPIGNATVQRFYQGHQKKAWKPGSALSVGGGVNRTTAVNGKVYLRVNFTTAVKYKIMMWYTRRHRLWGAANVEMNDSGEKVYPKKIRLGGGEYPPRIVSGAPKLRGRYRALLPFCATLLLMLMGFT